MTTVAIVPITNASGESCQATAGEVRYALLPLGDWQNRRTSPRRTDCSVGRNELYCLVIQSFRPDAFFSEAQQKRLSVLMELWRDLRDRGDRQGIDQFLMR